MMAGSSSIWHRRSIPDVWKNICSRKTGLLHASSATRSRSKPLTGAVIILIQTAPLIRNLFSSVQKFRERKLIKPFSGYGGHLKYENIICGKFIDRPNRFIARVDIGSKSENVHVKNTGRCRELLLPGTPGRKTKYDMVAVRKSNGVLFNIDSLAPNKVVKEWLSDQGFNRIIPEYTYGDSRIDFYMERRKERYLMEVKECTLEIDGIGYFPDAPTERGIKHLRELIRAAAAGYHAILAFVIQMDGVTEVRANTATHREFGEAMKEAEKSGVSILMLPCHVTPDSLVVRSEATLSHIIGSR